MRISSIGAKLLAALAAWRTTVVVATATAMGMGTATAMGMGTATVTDMDMDMDMDTDTVAPTTAQMRASQTNMEFVTTALCSANALPTARSRAVAC